MCQLRKSCFSKNQFNKLKSKKRIKELLNFLGISEEDLMVDNFMDIRNDSTHAESCSSLTEMEQWEVVQKAIQWVDEVILWRLGYGGQYRQKNLKSNQGIQPRYDLSRRDSSW